MERNRVIVGVYMMMAAFQRGRRHDPFQTIQGISLSAIIICSLVFLFVFNTIMSLTAPRFVDYHQLHEIQHFPLPPVLVFIQKDFLLHLFLLGYTFVTLMILIDVFFSFRFLVCEFVRT